jgi:adenosylcobinamide kinase/adenosylcobinamide-phosphate guanylyltransferase
MKIFYFGGQKSGKTKAGIKKAMELSTNKKPYYVATYDNSYNDSSMQERINKHIIHTYKLVVSIICDKNNIIFV